MSVFKELDNIVDKTKKTSFKTKRRYFKKSLYGNNRKSIPIDDFGNPLRANYDEDKTETISVSLPKSLVKILDNKRKKIPRSRYLREMIEYSLDVENTDKVL